MFPNSRVVSTERYPESASQGLADFQLGRAGQTLVVYFELDGQRLGAINAGPEFAFTEAVSFAAECRDQEQIDYYWAALSAVPEAEQCGWCKDRFGLSWQIVPEDMGELMKRPQAFAHLTEMTKLVISDF